METKTNPDVPPPAYQTFPQPGQQVPPASYPTESPPKYEPSTAPYQQGGVPYQQGYQANTVITTQPVVYLQNPGFGQTSKPMVCPNCQAQINTATEFETGALTWLSAGLLCVFGCWLGCCLVPFCINDLQDVKHTCPNCNKVVGYYRKL